MSEQPSEGFSDKPLPAPPSSEARGGFSETPLPPKGTGSDSLDDAGPDGAEIFTLRQIRELQERGQRGANWFFWVAGLSIVNSIAVHGGATTYFVVGLAITLVVDNIAKAIGDQNPGIQIGLQIFAIGFAVVVGAIVVGFGWLARRGMVIVFGIGMFLYLLDGLLFILLQDFMSVAFHAYALFSMWGGFSAFRQMRALEADLRKSTALKMSTRDDDETSLQH